VLCAGDLAAPKEQWASLCRQPAVHTAHSVHLQQTTLANVVGIVLHAKSTLLVCVCRRVWSFGLNLGLAWSDVSLETRLRLKTLPVEAVSRFPGCVGFTYVAAIGAVVFISAPCL
jgi:hypothetical protein